jgi:hypothetical protein
MPKAQDKRRIGFPKLFWDLTSNNLPAPTYTDKLDVPSDCPTQNTPQAIGYYKAFENTHLASTFWDGFDASLSRN